MKIEAIEKEKIKKIASEMTKIKSFEELKKVFNSQNLSSKEKYYLVNLSKFRKILEKFQKDLELEALK